MADNLAVPKGKKIQGPSREPDMLSKRGVPYFFAPEWVRIVNGTVGRIKPIKNFYNNVYIVELHMVSKTGNVTFIQGSIQDEFMAWHEDSEIDCILLGLEEDEILLTDWEYI